MNYALPSEPEGEQRIWMQRSVSQLLFSYLPGKTVDWEDGQAIVQLGGVRLSSSWEPKQATIVLKEIEAYLQRWQREGGIVPSSFPSPGQNPDRFTVGEPRNIAATILETTLYCLSCYRLVFTRKTQWSQSKKSGNRPFLCPSCKQPTLRQFPQIFVHGCGKLITLSDWMPTLKREGEQFTTTSYPLYCQKCGKQGRLEVPSRSERARDLFIRCHSCNQKSVDRLSARCHDCFNNPPSLPSQEDLPEEGHSKEPTIVDRLLMRSTSYRASEAYYPHTLTILRLDRPQRAGYIDEEVKLLRELLPASSENNDRQESSAVDALTMLTTHLQEAQIQGDTQAVNELMRQIAMIAGGLAVVQPTEPLVQRLTCPHPDLERSITESLAFKTTVHTNSYLDILSQDQQGATAGLLEEIRTIHEKLKLRTTLLVEDLPVITATFGFSRRSFEPTYEEGNVRLPTFIRPFYPLDAIAVKQINRPSAKGTLPILAREGDHEGIFLSLDPEQVIKWLGVNGLPLLEDHQPPIVRLLQAIEDEEIDRYYDTIWRRPKLRLIFGLLHTLSHATMRVVSRFAGLERTSISEYLFPPLLGTVVYANSSTFKMGCMETMIRSNFFEFLEALSKEAISCLIDPDCIDHRGACAGCLHSPEISCRVFNHGLSRAFLIGGHAPWADVTTDENIIGYWQS